MYVWYISTGRTYDGIILEAIRSAGLGAVEVLQQQEFPSKFNTLSTSAQGLELSLVVDVDCTTTIQSLLKFAERLGKRRLEGLKVIALSSLITWGGACYKGSIRGTLDDFRSRVPLASAYPQYAIENALLGAASRHEFSLCLIGFGLFYGANGMDLKDMFSFIWGKKAAAATPAAEDAAESTQNQMVLPCNGDTCVPLINISRFRDIVLSALKSPERQPRFIAAVDSNSSTAGDRTVSFCDNISSIDMKLNDRQQSLIVAKGASAGGDRDGAVVSPLWQCSLPFSSETSSVSLLDSIDEVWEEFLQDNCLAPVSIAVAGPPRVGKSDLAAMIADKLQVEHVTPESSVRFLHRLDLASVPAPVPVPAAEGDAADPALSDAAALFRQAKEELKAAAEAKANEGKKPAKGAVVAEEGVIDEAIFTAAFCLTLAPELLRKCIYALVTLHSGCRRRGFVLDAWDGRVITDAASLNNTLNAQGESLRQLELVVELQCPPNLPVEKLVSSQGAQAKAKESQAAVKALEGLVAAYNSNLVALEEAAGQPPASAEHMKSGHKGVVEIVAGEGSSCRVCRLNAAAAVEGQVLADMAQSVVQAALALKGGCIGWLDTPLAYSTPQSGPTESAVACADSSTGGVSVPEELQSQLESSGDAPAQGAPSALAQQLQQLEVDKLAALADKAAKLQEFLSATVLPQVTEGLVRIQREQPEDPILFLAQQLLQHSADRNSQAEGKARLRFVELLHQGGL